MMYMFSGIWDIRIVHDKAGSYADWRSSSLHHGATVKRYENYLLGKTTPHYPVPALRMEVRFWPDLVTLHYQDGLNEWRVKSTLNKPF